jgi:dephospho-CoA kinase
MRKIKNKWITKNQSTRLYSIPVPIIGLTGGIATGKSTVANLFRLENVPVIDADQLVKGIYKKEESLNFIKENFAEATDGNSINFKILREVAFKTPENQQLIEQFIYAQMPEAFTEAFQSFSNPAFIVYDVPLLFEKKLDKKIDVSVCTYSPRAIQLARLIARDHIKEELAQTILSRQMNIEDKKLASDLVIENMTTFEELKINFEKFLNELVER